METSTQNIPLHNLCCGHCTQNIMTQEGVQINSILCNKWSYKYEEISFKVCYTKRTQFCMCLYKSLTYGIYVELHAQILKFDIS
jgi:hypothetical protein